MQKFSANLKNGIHKVSVRKYGIEYDDLATLIAFLEMQQRDLQSKDAISLSAPKLRYELQIKIKKLKEILNS